MTEIRKIGCSLLLIACSNFGCKEISYVEDPMGEGCSASVREVYQIKQPALYEITAVSDIQDGCDSNPSSLIATVIEISADPYGIVHFYREDGMTPYLGGAMIMCNQGRLFYAGTVVDGLCSYSVERMSNVTVLARDRIQAHLVEN
jgi:hypothetical protein